MLLPTVRVSGQEVRRLPPVELTPPHSAGADLPRLPASPPPPAERIVPAAVEHVGSTNVLTVTRARFEQALRCEDFSIDIGGYVKADFIHDFNPIGSKDVFDPLTIPTDGLQGENTRMHARQTRLNLDYRPNQENDDLKLFVEGDFFGEGGTFRLRHAYIRAGRLLAGQT